jgi:hypothetical protein
MNKNKIIYSLNVDDILNVMEEIDIHINLNEDAIKFIQDKVGNKIDWKGAIEFALFEFENQNKSKSNNG